MVCRCPVLTVLCCQMEARWAPSSVGLTTDGARLAVRLQCCDVYFYFLCFFMAFDVYACVHARGVCVLCVCVCFCVCVCVHVCVLIHVYM